MTETKYEIGQEVEVRGCRGSWGRGAIVQQTIATDPPVFVVLLDGTYTKVPHANLRAVYATSPLLVAVVSSELSRPAIVARCKAMKKDGDRLFVICDSNILTSLCLMESAGIEAPLVVGEQIHGFDILIGYAHGTGGRNAKDI